MALTVVKGSTLSDPVVAVTDLTEVAADTPASNDVIYYDGANWVLADVDTIITPGAVDKTAGYAWTGTHSFAVKLLPTDINLTSNYTWSGTHSFSTKLLPSDINLTSTYAWTGTHSFATKLLPSDINLTSTYAWTGTHSFATKLLPTDINLTSTYAWTGTHTFSTRPTFNSNTPYDSGNINEAVVAINAQVGTTYTTLLTDRGNLVTLSNAAGIACTIPPNSSVAYPVGSILTFAQIGAGQVTLTAGAGVTLNTEVGLLLNAQYAQASAVKTATDTWLVTGSLSV